MHVDCSYNNQEYYNNHIRYNWCISNYYQWKLICSFWEFWTHHFNISCIKKKIIFLFENFLLLICLLIHNYCLYKTYSYVVLTLYLYSMKRFVYDCMYHQINSFGEWYLDSAIPNIPCFDCIWSSPFIINRKFLFCFPLYSISCKRHAMHE